MYGYFNHKKSHLNDNEYTVFTCYYCRLCYCLWNKGGQKARYLTTYDAVVYNLILAIAGFDQCPPHFPCERVKTNNKKKFKDDKMGNLIADLAVIGFAIKVKDDEVDGDGKRAFIANLFFKKIIKNTVESHRELYEKSYASIAAMDRLQRHAPIEEVLCLYGKIMEDSFHYFFDLEEKYLRVFNAIAQWSLLIDMLDDYDDDFKKKTVNSLYREDSPTIKELFQKHYYELIPLVQGVSQNLKEALEAIESDMVEWIVLTKILQHSLATLVPDILSGVDVRYHYFRELLMNCSTMRERRKFNKKHEKITMHNQGN